LIIDSSISSPRDRQARPYSRGHRLIHEVNLSRAGSLGAVHDRTAFDGRDTARDRYHHAGVDQMASTVNLADEVAEHRLGDLKVADNSVF